jgi:hypothetical protein
MELAALCSAVKLYGRIETLAMLLDQEVPEALCDHVSVRSCRTRMVATRPESFRFWKELG